MDEETKKHIDTAITMPANRLLGLKGKNKLFKGLKEYIEAKIDYHTISVRPSLNQEQVEARLAKAEADFELIIMSLEWHVE